MLIAENTAQKCSSKEAFCKYVANLQENTHAERRFQLSCIITSVFILYKLSCKFSADLQNNLFKEHLWTTASVIVMF